MNRKRGRRPGKVYPQPDNIFEGIWNAHWGKIGTSEAMLIAMFCPYRLWGPRKLALWEKEALKGLPRAPWSKKLLKQLGRRLEKWDCEIGPCIGRKIATGDYQFFHQLGAAVEELAKEEPQAHSLNRLFALEYKLLCLTVGQPFTVKGLGNFYGQRGHRIDSSTLSKMYHWARLAKVRKLRAIPGCY